MRRFENLDFVSNSPLPNLAELIDTLNPLISAPDVREIAGGD